MDSRAFRASFPGIARKDGRTIFSSIFVLKARMVESLAFRTARRRVGDFADESKDLMKLHAEAMDCRDCETFLQLGIDAFVWLVRADETLRKEVFAGSEKHDPQQIIYGMECLFKAWLETCAFANQWISRQLDRGFDVDNLNEFRKCEREVRAIVKAFSYDELSDAMRQLRDQAIAEHRDGKTAEFVSE